MQIRYSEKIKSYMAKKGVSDLLVYLQPPTG